MKIKTLNAVKIISKLFKTQSTLIRVKTLLKKNTIIYNILYSCYHVYDIRVMSRYIILCLMFIIRTCCPRNSSVLDQCSHSELFERAVSGHQTVSHGAHHVNVTGPESVHAGRPDGTPAESRRCHVLARERHRSWKRRLPPDSRGPGCHDDIFAHGRRLRE